MSHRHARGCSTSLIKRKTQIRATRDHLPTVRVANTDTTRNNRCRWGCGEGDPLALLAGKPLWETGWSFSRQLKTELPYSPTTSLLVTYTENAEILNQRRAHTLLFMATLQTRAELGKQSKCPLIGEDGCHTDAHTISAIKRKGILPLAKQVHVEKRMQSQKEEKKKANTL